MLASSSRTCTLKCISGRNINLVFTLYFVKNILWNLKIFSVCSSGNYANDYKGPGLKCSLLEALSIASYVAILHQFVIQQCTYHQQNIAVDSKVKALYNKQGQQTRTTNKHNKQEQQTNTRKKHDTQIKQTKNNEPTDKRTNATNSFQIAKRTYVPSL